MQTPRRRLFRRTLPALALGAGAAWLAGRAHLPLPWILAPLLVIAVLRSFGAPFEPLRGGQQAGQWLVGTLLGLHFTPALVTALAGHGTVIVLLAAASAGFGFVTALVLLRWSDAGPATAFFAAVPAGASEMAVLAERQRAAVDRVAASHALRLLIVVTVIPFALAHWSVPGNEPPLAPHAPGAGEMLPLFLLCTFGGGLLLRTLRIANAWLLGPLALSGTLTALALPTPALPDWLGNAGQLLLGVALGCRFGPGFFRRSPRFLALSAAGTLLTLGLSVALAYGLASQGFEPFPSLVLAAAPGGIAEMSLTAAALQRSVPLVITAHLLRVTLLTVFGMAMFRAFQASRPVRALVRRKPPGN